MRAFLNRSAARIKHRLHRRRQSARSRLRHGRLHESYWSLTTDDRGHLCADGLSLVEVAKRFGTPLHVVNEAVLEKDYRQFLTPFRSRYQQVHLATSYKTNPLPAVLQALHGYGTWAEVISDYELWLALRLGVEPERIIFNGPGKTRAGLETAVERSIRLINVDGLEEIKELEAIAAESPPSNGAVRVGVRLTTSVGWQSQFGLSISDGLAQRAFRMLKDSDELEPAAVHLHLGTGISELSAYRQAIEEVLRFSLSLKQRMGIQIETYDLGGGFGVPTVRFKDRWDRHGTNCGYPSRTAIPEDAPSPEDYASLIVGLFDELAPRSQDGRPTIVLEPGRAITSRSQVLLLSVLRPKQTAADNPMAIMDGGKNVAIPLGYESHVLLPASRMDERPRHTYDLYGPLCHPHDIIGKNLRMPRLERGDPIAVMDAGAYFIPNQMNFSHPRPAVIMLEDGSPASVRTREEFDDLVRHDELRAPQTAPGSDNPFERAP